jgi:hypothetical protein
MKRTSLFLLVVATIIALPLMSLEQDSNKGSKRSMFLPKPLDDDWTRWIIGQWEGSGDSTAGKGKGTSKIELGLNGQFLIFSGEAEITEINADYLKKNMHATDEEIERFINSPYRALEIYTIDQKTGEVVGYLFDSLRCMAQGRGKREGNKEIMEWQWISGHKSTRITEKISDDKMAVIEKTPMPDGSVMEDKGEMIRIKKQPVSANQ